MRNLIPSKNDQARFSIHPLPFLVNLNVLLSTTIFTGDRGGGVEFKNLKIYIIVQGEGSISRVWTCPLLDL